MQNDLHTFIHITFIHTTYIHTYIHTYIKFLGLWIHAYIHTYIHTYHGKRDQDDDEPLYVLILALLAGRWVLSREAEDQSAYNWQLVVCINVAFYLIFQSTVHLRILYLKNQSKCTYLHTYIHTIITYFSGCRIFYHLDDVCVSRCFGHFDRLLPTLHTYDYIHTYILTYNIYAYLLTHIRTQNIRILPYKHTFNIM